MHSTLQDSVTRLDQTPQTGATPSGMNRVSGSGIRIPEDLMGQMEKLDGIDDKAAPKAKTSELNIDHFATFIKELRKTSPGTGCHIMAVRFEEIVKEIIAASGLKA